MGTAASGRHADGGPVAEELDDCRFDLKDSQDELRQAMVLMHHAEAFVNQARKREQRAIARITLAQQKLGYTGIRPEEVIRVEEMTVRTSEAAVEPIGDPGSLAKFADSVNTDARARVAAKRGT